MSRHLTGAFAAPLLLLSACAASGSRDGLASIESSAEIGQTLRGSPDLAADAGTVRFEMEVSTSEGGQEALILTTTGSADRAAGRLALQVDLAGMVGGIRDDELPPGMDEPAEVVVADGTVYLRIPLLDELTGTSGWLSGSPEEMAVSGASEPTGGRGIYDPFALLDVLHGASDAGEPDGRDDVRGVPTIRYSATVRIADALNVIPEDRRVALQAQLTQLGGSDAPIPVEVWVDGDGLPRRLRMSFADPASARTAEKVSVAIAIELFDYGLPVSIAVPGPDEVTPYGEAMEAMARAFSESGA